MYKYLPLKQPGDSADCVEYSGGPCEDMDRDFTEGEVRAALRGLFSRSAAGHDGIIKIIY